MGQCKEQLIGQNAELTGHSLPGNMQDLLVIRQSLLGIRQSLPGSRQSLLLGIRKSLPFSRQTLLGSRQGLP